MVFELKIMCFTIIHKYLYYKKILFSLVLRTKNLFICIPTISTKIGTDLNNLFIEHLRVFILNFIVTYMDIMVNYAI